MCTHAINLYCILYAKMHTQQTIGRSTSVRCCLTARPRSQGFIFITFFYFIFSLLPTIFSGVNLCRCSLVWRHCAFLLGLSCMESIQPIRLADYLQHVLKITYLVVVRLRAPYYGNFRKGTLKTSWELRLLVTQLPINRGRIPGRCIGTCIPMYHTTSTGLIKVGIGLMAWAT